MNLIENIIPMKEKELKHFLGNRKSEEIEWDEKTKQTVVKSMLIHIGSPDSKLRDNLIYHTFCQLIMENKLEKHFLCELLETCLSDQFLFKGIGEKDTDSVFTRSFTSLLIALILYQDNRDDFLSVAKVLEVKDKLISYVNLEKDVRGYVKEKGWAHSVAHVADAFDELVKSKKITQSNYPEMLQAIFGKIYQTESVYIHDEEERVIVPIVQMIDNGLEKEVLETFIKNIRNELEIYKKKLEEENYWFLVANCKNFLKSLLLEILNKPSVSSMQAVVIQTIKEIY
ncbi:MULTISPECIES: DUF2785 domain-containing protein [unclassified Bacillus (in: firmicutes)]|uniref:DUF2785 domain-containing protein n=1 Tax=unclassified Bacillus (in: firmicutes) TaxID=185979 RepID=UPI00068E5E39|nr:MULTISPECIES: DUF2785 domain-containing protein [unclassified Bacillus (in: firmicutes)]